MKKLPLAVLGFVGLYLFFTLALVPASYVVSLAKLPEGLSYRSVEGSVWHIQLKQVAFQDIQFSHVDITPSILGSLFSLAPSASFTLGGRTDAIQASGKASLSQENATLSDFDALIPANTIVDYAKLPMPVEAKGDVNLAIETFGQNAQGCTELAGTITWPKARVNVMNEQLAVGDIEAQLSCERGEIVLSIDDSAKLGLVFTLKVAQSGTYYGDGYFKPTPQTPEQITQFLPMMGRADDQGRYPLRL